MNEKNNPPLQNDPKGDREKLARELEATRQQGLMQRDRFNQQFPNYDQHHTPASDKGQNAQGSDSDSDEEEASNNGGRRRRKSKKKSRRRRKSKKSRRRKSKKKSRRRRKSKKSRRRRKSKKSRRRRRKRKVMKGGSSINYSIIDNSLKGENARILGSHSYTTSDNCGDAYNHYTGGKVKSLY